ncbi:MAG TPA: NAD(P)-dependent oxidoreductase [Candidatus Saccharimonadales bacterium]|nr:NAD(P)-dependent oxidoreductase [Candidatus Saccharimonadales bacterium]HSX27484.1 NAD(P)-dependent oxidoreductase [Patescibacteria group bacterium]
MSNKILVTDSLFIFNEHVKQLEAVGYEVERLDKPRASEEELCRAVKGKIGYILGGVEQVTEKVIDAADDLKAIVFTGIDYKNFIPGWKLATEKSIAIANAPDGPTQAVAEWAIGATLLMNRGFLELGHTGNKNFATTKGIENQAIGIIGFGRIGKRIAEMLKPFNSKSISYWSPHTRDTTGLASYAELDRLLSGSDILYLAVPAGAENLLEQNMIETIKEGSLLVTFTHGKVIDEKALLKRLENGSMRAISDNPIENEAFKKLPLNTWFCFNGSNAFNTETEIKMTSDMVIRSLLNLLKTGNDTYRVN